MQEILQMKNSQILPQQAAQELLNRRIARKSLIKYTEYTKPDFEVAEHHKIISEALEEVAMGVIDRLMIFAPPRHTKSELASRRFPSWYIGNNPSKQIITACYNSDLASDFGREVRNIVDSHSYKRLFNTQLAADSKAANRWHTKAERDGAEVEGAYVAAGVGTAITGRGAHIALIDDPFKDREEANSETTREKVYNWYTSTLYTRLMPGGAIVLIMTRWHEDDLAGRLLEDMKNGKDQWKIINLQAIANEGTNKEKALWPEWYNLDALKRIKNAIGHKDWSALYQQKPQPDEGVFFKREWFEQNRFRLGEEPPTKNYQSSDFAVSGGEGDFTELAIWGLCKDSELWAKDWWYNQDTADIWIEKLLDQYKRHQAMAFFGEMGVIRKAIEPFLTKRSRQRRIYPRIEWINRTKDKKAMARAFQGMASMGLVHIPRTEWGDRLIDQLVAFDSGKYDDAVDNCALIGLAIDMAHPAILASQEELDDESLDCWGRPKQDNGSWKVG